MDLDSEPLRDSGFDRQKGFALSLGEAACRFPIEVNPLDSLAVGAEQCGDPVMIARAPAFGEI
jgi:hypothetical protein